MNEKIIKGECTCNECFTHQVCFSGKVLRVFSENEIVNDITRIVSTSVGEAIEFNNNDILYDLYEFDIDWEIL